MTHFSSDADVLDYFKISERRAITVTWDHAVNSRAHLEKALADEGIMMLEADIRLFGEGTVDQDRSQQLPVMAHDPVTYYDITFEEWIRKVMDSDQRKGVKLDFKSTEGFIAALKLLKEMKDRISFPVWINADMLPGPNADKECNIEAKIFFDEINRNFSQCTVSPGWITGANTLRGNEKGYTENMIQDMLEAVKNLKTHVSFPIRASYVKSSTDQLKRLLATSERYSLTIWHSDYTENLEVVHLAEAYHVFPKHQIFFDIPKPLMDKLKSLICS